MNDDRYIVVRLVVHSNSPGALSSREKKLKKTALDKAHFGAF